MNKPTSQMLLELYDLRDQLDRTTRIVGSLYKVCTRLEQLHQQQLKLSQKKSA